jgi:hypothetical protein
MVRQSARASSANAVARMAVPPNKEKKAEIARKAAMMIIGGVYANPAAAACDAAFAGVSEELIRRKTVELKKLHGIETTAATFCEQRASSEEPAATAEEDPEVAPLPHSAPPLPLKERKVLWMKAASRKMSEHHQAGLLGPGKKGTWMIEANALYGEDAQYSRWTVARQVERGRAGEAPKTLGKPPEFPAAVMVDLIVFIGLLREMKLPV